MNIWLLAFIKVHLNRKVHQKGPFYLNGKFKKQPFKKYVSLNKLRLVASNKRSFKKQPSKKQTYKKLLCS